MAKYGNWVSEMRNVKKSFAHHPIYDDFKRVREARNVEKQ